MPQPLISVLLPVYNENGDYLATSIESILQQTLGDFELLIFDDGSTSPSCSRLLDDYVKKDPRIRVIRNEKNIGLTNTLNQGLQMARGEFIARQDSDDIAEMHRLEKQLAFMRKNPECALCGTWANVIDEDGKIIGKQEGTVGYDKIKKNIILINSFVHASWFFRKSAILSLGGYSKEMLKAQDYDLLLKLAIQFPIDNIPEYLCSYRMRGGSITFRDNKASEKYALAARLKAIRDYGYPKSDYLKIIRPVLFYYLVPSPVKKLLMRLLWKI